MARINPDGDTIAGWGRLCHLTFRDIFIAADQEYEVIRRVPSLFRQPKTDSAPILALSDLHDEWEQFRVWSKNLGVFAEDHGSLDFRLRDAEEVAEGLIALLKGLHNDLDQSLSLLKSDRVIDSSNIGDAEDSESDDSDSDSSSTADGDQSIRLSAWELQRRLESVADTINKLMKLAEVIRASGVKSRTLKAAHYVHMEDGINQTEVFEREYLPQVLKHRFNLEEPLLSRLCRAISLRRRRFQYQAAHQKRLNYGLVALEKSLDRPAGLGNNAGNLQALARSSRKPQLDISVSGARTTASSLQPPTKATTFQRPNVRRTSPSTLVSRPRKSDETEVDIPPLPPIERRAKHFQCPYCRLLIDESKRTPRKWRNHVIGDLQPFICVEPDCESGDAIFDSQDEWTEHQKWEHSMQWWCEGDETDHEPLSFNNPEEYAEHLKSHHGSAVDGKKLSNQVITAGRPGLAPFSCCPFCSYAPSVSHSTTPGVPANKVLSEITAQEKLQDHIADELLTMFLLALPGRDDIRDTESDTQQTRGGRLRSSAQDLLDIPLIFDDITITGQDQAEDEQQNDWGPTIPTSFWEMVWSSPQLRNTVRESYEGPQNDVLLKEIERAQMAILEEEEETQEAWIPALVVTDAAGMEEFEVVRARPLAEEASGHYHSHHVSHLDDGSTFSIIAQEYDHDGFARPDLLADDFATSFPPS